MYICMYVYMYVSIIMYIYGMFSIYSNSSGYTSGQFYQPPTDPVWGQTTLSTSPGTHQPLTLPQHQPLF